jgi:hypothetical protein
VKICGKAWTSWILILIEQAVGDGSITIDTAVAQERPVAADVFQRLQVDIADQDFFAVMGGFGQYTAKGVAEERATPEFESRARG